MNNPEAKRRGHLLKRNFSIQQYNGDPFHSNEGKVMKKEANQDRIFYRSLGKYYPIISHGQGIYLYDTDGKRYIDGSGSAAVVSIGHGVREITEAMIKQAEKGSFVHSSQFTSDSAIAFAERIVSLAPEGLNKIYFLSGGSEAV